jgi:hypothetical protein
MATMPAGALEIRGPADGLLDDPLGLTVRGAGGGPVTWRARLRDDQERVWRAGALEAEGLALAWAPGKPTPQAGPALGSLRPVALEVRVEAPDGRAAHRTVTRRLLAEGVERRRWREPGLTAVLHLPARRDPVATVLLEEATPAAVLAAPLLASRGALVLALHRGDRGLARERLGTVPRAGAAIEALALAEAPPGVPGWHGDPDAWDALLARLGADPRRASG